jgi:hypothetical protein
VTPEQVGALIGLGALFVIGAIVVGYTVYRIVPDRHYPEVAGVLAAIATIAALAAAGIDPAPYILIIVVVIAIIALIVFSGGIIF